MLDQHLNTLGISTESRLLYNTGEVTQSDLCCPQQARPQVEASPGERRGPGMSRVFCKDEKGRQENNIHSVAVSYWRLCVAYRAGQYSDMISIP